MYLFRYIFLLVSITYLYSSSTPRLDSVEVVNSNIENILAENIKQLIVQEINVKNIESKILDLKSELQKLKDTHDTYRIEKYTYNSKMNENTILIESQDKRIGDINFYLIAWGVLITLILVVMIWKSKRESIEAAKDAIEKWLQDNAIDRLDTKINEVLLTKNDEIDKLLVEQVDSKIMPMYNKTKAMLKDIEGAKDDALVHRDEMSKMSNEMFKSISQEDLKILEGKEEATLTSKEYYQLGVESYTKQNFNTALNSFISAVKKSEENSMELLKALFAKAVTLGQLDKSEEEITIYDELILKFKDNKESGIQEQVATAMVNKGYRLGQLDKSEEAITIYDELILKFKDNKESGIQEQVAKAMVNKIEFELIIDNNISNKTKELIEKFDFQKNKMTIDMLLILSGGIQKLQDYQIKDWKEKYNNSKFETFGFDELDTWSTTIEDQNERNRIIRYLDIFKLYR